MDKAQPEMKPAQGVLASDQVDQPKAQVAAEAPGSTDETVKTKLPKTQQATDGLAEIKPQVTTEAPGLTKQADKSKLPKIQDINDGLAKIKPQDLGLKTYYTPPPERETEVDIVAVHGLAAFLSLRMEPEDWPNISTDSVKGMVFLGTPHHGVADGILSQPGQIYRSILASNIHHDRNILDSVQRNNDVLKRVVHDFTRRIHNMSPRPEIYCFFEQKATNVTKVAANLVQDIPLTYLVDETSGTLSGHQKEQLPLDHFNMNKFENEEDDNYRCVSRVVVTMAKKSTTMINREPSSAGAKVNRGRHIPALPAPIATENRFAPRGGLLEKIVQKFESSGRVALYGPAGTGYWKEYGSASHVLWVNAGTAEQFECSYKRIAEDRHLVREGMDMASVIEAVWKFLRYESSGHWLMILDGMEKEASLQATSTQHHGRSLLEFIPNSVHSSVLITTQSKSLSLHQVGKLSDNSVEMPTLDEKDASILMLGKETGDAYKKKWIEGIAKAVNNLPIGFVLTQIYRRQVETSMNRRQVLEAVEAHSKEKLPAARAWNLLTDLMKKQHPESVNLMLIMGAINLQSVPGTFLDRAQISKQIPILTKYGIVEPSVDKRVYHITSAIRECVLEWLIKNPDQKAAIEELVLSTICERLTPETSEGLLPCALAVSEYQAHSSSMRENMVKLQRAISEHYNRSKQFSSALRHLQECIKILEADPVIKNRKDILAQTKRDVEKTEKNLKTKSRTTASEPDTERLAKAQFDVDRLITNNDYGKDPHKTFSRISELANMQLLRPQKKGTDNTLDLYQRILDWHQAKVKADHVGTARHQYNLALAYDSKGKFDKAEKLYHSALNDGLKEKTHEALVLRFRILSNLVCSYGRQERLEDAQEVLQTLLPEQMEFLGWDHPDTLVTRHSAALLLQERGSVRDAGGELRRILDVQRSLLDPDDPALFRTACSLALNFRLQGRHREAKELFQETLKLQKQLLGKDHVDTAKTKQMLKELLQAVSESVNEG
ncbi:hypothetical protein NW762_003185 [Fusarium torreyae]|uniref:Kinesin light chain n=1 Tax=Fusarium torreyae TaxID=1237075 RepID=A0A9W8S793_9HYPO|nr:hypothetical protein NW762_003185 [Fusarium torreyae]